MATTDLSQYNSDAIPNASEMSFGIVVSEWNSEITNALLQGACETLVKHGAKEENIHIVYVPGSFELIYGSQQLINYADVHAVIALGSVVRGGTPHFEYVCQGTTQGIAQLNAKSDIPVIFGLLTTDDMQQALDRAGGIHGNKGIEAAITAIKMAKLFVVLEK